MYEPAIHTERRETVGSRPERQQHSLGRRLSRLVPTVLVLAALAALAWWGHHTGWSLPSFAALTGKEQDEKDDWCDAHGVAKSACVECDEKLLPRVADFGWCPEHGVANCILEHPEIAQLPGAARITAEDLARARRALHFAPRPENSKQDKLYLRRIQFASQEAFDRSGIKVQQAGQGPITESVAAPGEIMYDQTQIARLSARAPGAVWRVSKQVGDPVRRGEVLALVDAAEVGKAKAEFLMSAAAQLHMEQRLQSLKGSGLGIAEQRVHEAEAELKQAKIRFLGARQTLVNLGLPVDADKLIKLPASEMAAHLQFLGLPDDICKTLDPRTTTANLLPIRSPLDGVVINRDVVEGEVVDTARVLFITGNVRRMWLILYLRQQDAARVAPGQTVHFRPDGTATDVQGKVAWVSTAVEDKTRTVKVRVDLPNANGRLRANTFGKGQIVLRAEKHALLVPSEAVHSTGESSVVFVRDKNFLTPGSPKVFHVRMVRVGASDGDNTEIIAGVLPGEIVATRGSGALRGELLKVEGDD